MLSQTCQIAIKAAIYLSQQQGRKGSKVGVLIIAKEINASEHPVGKVLQRLVKNDIIISQKGPTGGFYMSEEQRRLPIIKIVHAIDGKDTFRRCALGLTNCSASHPCPIHEDYEKARAEIEKVFKKRRIIDLCEKVEEGVCYLMT
ncbi:MAG TPA: Rrf2 family transcriptional regulator [Chitinophagaceae bacterium]|nr:Rrf2 family transcriptional regulator [Chitinophagaceae bacterium]